MLLQQARNNASGDATRLATPQPDAREDDRLLAASVQVRPNPPLPTQVLPIRLAIQDGDPHGVLTLTPSLLQPTLWHKTNTHARFVIGHAYFVLL